MTPEDVAKRAEALIAGLSDIPVEELVQCARENLKAYRRVRLSKDDPDGKEEPDFAVRQKTLEWISAQRAGAPSQRKPIEPVKASDDRPEPGSLRAKGKKAE